MFIWKNRTGNDAYLSGVCTGLNSALSTESTNRVNGDNTLHQEIQGITSVTHSVNSVYSNCSATLGRSGNTGLPMMFDWNG